MAFTKIHKNTLSHMRLILRVWVRVLKLIWKTHPGYVTCFIGITILTGLLPSIQIQLTSSIVQNVSLAIQGKNVETFTHVAILSGILQGIVLLFAALLGIINQQIQSLLNLRLGNNINIQIMSKAAKLDLQHYEDSELYDKLQRASNESAYRPSQIFIQMSSVAGQFVTLISVVGVLFTWNWWLALLILVAPLPTIGSSLFYSQRGYKIERERTPIRRRLAYFQFLLTRSSSVKEIRLFRLADHFLGLYKKHYHDFYTIDSKLVKRQSSVQFPFTFLTNLVSVCAQIYIILVTIASRSIGLLAGYMQAVGAVQGSISGISGGLVQLYQNNLYLSGLFEFLDVSPKRLKQGTTLVPARLQKGIEFRGVSFSYPGTTKPILKDINLLLKAGECVALVGHNGAGKTTFVKLLTRLYEPTKGQIFIDDVPLEEYDLASVRQHIGVIFQDFVHYEMTVRENIGFGYLEESNNINSIQKAAQDSGADTFIQQLPDNVETTLGRMFEKGQELSGGQWQKVALARAFMHHAPILVLDEPTSATDAETEAEIFGRMQQIAQGATTLLIAHRFSTVRMADRILVVDDGAIVEDGNHEELMRVNGIYARLFKLQAAGYMDAASTAPSLELPLAYAH